MNKYTIEVEGFKLNPLARKWTNKISQIRQLPRRTLKRIYKKYFGVTPKGCSSYELHMKISYYFQRLAFKVRNKKMKRKIRIRTKRILKAKPGEMVSVLRGTIFETPLMKIMEGGDTVGKAVKGKALRKKGSKSKGTISALVYSLIKKGWNDDKIIKLVRKRHPGSKINSVHMNWYRAQLKKTKSSSKVKKSDKKKKSREEEDEEEEEDEDDEEEEEEEEDEDEDEEEEDEEEEEEDEEEEEEAPKKKKSKKRKR